MLRLHDTIRELGMRIVLENNKMTSPSPSLWRRQDEMNFGKQHGTNDDNRIEPNSGQWSCWNEQFLVQRQNASANSSPPALPQHVQLHFTAQPI